MSSFAELTSLYVEQLLRGLRRSESTIHSFHLAVREFIHYCQHQENLTDPRCLEPRHFTGYLRFLKERPLTATTAYSRQRQVRTWLAWLTLQQHLLLDPSKAFHWRHPQLLPKGSPSEAQMLRILQAPRTDTPLGQRDRAVMEFLYGTGLRILECSLVDLEHVCLTRLQVQVVHGKGGRPRTVPFGPHLANILQDYLENVRPGLHQHEESALWLNHDGHRFAPKHFRCRLQSYRVGDLAGISAHSFRHAYATHLLARGAPIVALQRLLGHANLQMTSHYLSLVPVDVQQTILKTHPRGRQRSPKG